MIEPAQLAAAMMQGTVLCPHPKEREQHAITVRGRSRPMTLCGAICWPMFGQLLERWDAGRISPSEVVTTMRQSGYTRGDAARFLLDLAARRLKMRLGFPVGG
jgi:hypothetical protein